VSYTYTRREFDAAYEEFARHVTNPNGRGNAAYDRDASTRMPPQDRLLEAEITMGQTTGIAVEFRWASGRKDVWAVLDLPLECVAPDVAEARQNYIAQLKERNREQEKAA
jgi:hypothetical protein